MKKVTKLILMLCFILSGAFCFAHGEARTDKNGDGTPVEVIEASCLSGLPRGNSIDALPVLLMLAPQWLNANKNFAHNKLY